MNVNQKQFESSYHGNRLNEIANLNIDMIKLQLLFVTSISIICSILLFSSYDVYGNQSYERQEIRDDEDDFYFWSFGEDVEKVTIDGKNNEIIKIPIGKKSTCTENGTSPFEIPDIKSVSYMSNNKTFNSTLWLVSGLIERDLFKNDIDKDNINSTHPIMPLWIKAGFHIIIDINSVFDEGVDYTIDLIPDRINDTIIWKQIMSEHSTVATKTF